MHKDKLVRNPLLTFAFLFVNSFYGDIAFFWKRLKQIRQPTKRGLPERGILGFAAEAYSHKREDGLRDLGARFVKAGDGRPRFYISSRCVNIISELLEYNVEVKESNHMIQQSGLVDCRLS